MMKPQKNSRQMPTNIEITAEKAYYDKLYAYFQSISERNEDTGERYFKKPTLAQMHETLNLAPGTLSTRFKELEKLGLITQSLYNKKIYILKKLSNDEAYLIPTDTLGFLARTMQRHVITIYIHLLKMYVANKEQTFMFTIENLKGVCGEFTGNSSNNGKYTDALFALQAVGLIKTFLKKEPVGNSFRTHYYCSCVKQYYDKTINNFSLYPTPHESTLDR